MKTVLKNPVDVQMHWTRKLLPRPSQERVNAISDVIARGVKLPPGYLVEPNLLVAGETRRLAHKARQVDMEFIVISEEEAAAIALGENTNRLGYKFKYQVAFAYCPLALKVVEFSSRNRGAVGVAGAKPQYCGPATLAEVAAAIHVSERCLEDSKQTYDALLAWDKENEPKKWGELKNAKMTALAYWTMRIMDQEESCTPGQARAGLAGSKAAEEGKTQPAPKQLELFLDGFRSLGKWGKSFPKFDDEQRRTAVKQIKKTISDLPAELRAEIAAEIKLLEREAKEAK
ncbi:hypothetical protein [Silvimonas sp.]|uniref:hypothetical protein n=1 Tax=Silvimonas sp. TaxID=2650811 RepID=UPI0028493C49|nr:hypothetical protein [Silvimonas sp.]MDR3427831.1 hypothetical protein [Silvimonas sp.]